MSSLDTTLQDGARWIAGIIVAAVLVYMSFLSLQEDFSLSVPVIAGMLAVIVLLMYGTTELTRLIDSWRGTPRQRRPNRGGQRDGTDDDGHD